MDVGWANEALGGAVESAWRVDLGQRTAVRRRRRYRAALRGLKTKVVLGLTLREPATGSRGIEERVMMSFPILKQLKKFSKFIENTKIPKKIQIS